MSIHFTTIRWKNFLSTGNAFTELQLDTHPTTLVVGENGSGKSTMLDAICFALFGKPYRNINKPQLVNTINNKNCVVEIEFFIGKKLYKIVRGIKPSIFEIWLNNVLLNQDAASRDYQKHLEENILKLNYKSFTQIVILGAASFTPFMQLPAASRREVIEDILDIKIFSAMNTVLKEKTTDLKVEMNELDNKITIAKTKAQLQQDYIKTLEQDRNVRIEEINKKIQETLHDIKEKYDKQSMLICKKEQCINTIVDSQQVIDALRNISKNVENYVGSITKIENEILFYHNNDTCPKCKQGIQHEFKVGVILEQQEELSNIQDTIEKIETERKLFEHRMKEIQQTQKEIEQLTEEIHAVKTESSAAERYLQRLELEKLDVGKKVGNIENEKEKLKDLAKNTISIIKERSELNEIKDYYEIASILLKDSGVKTKIIRQYLPVINKLVNKFLSSMDFFVQFTLDEKFNEVIKSRYRDDFSYESFSEGEKQRIDLSLLFTWRTIAKLKNSASTNLLILDEIFDSSLDNSATEYVMQLLNTSGAETNIWVISHKGDQLESKFSHVLRFTKKMNFSVVSACK